MCFFIIVDISHRKHHFLGILILEQHNTNALCCIQEQNPATKKSGTTDGLIDEFQYLPPNLG